MLYLYWYVIPYNLTVLLYCIYALNFDGCKQDTSPYHFNTLLVFCFIFLNCRYILVHEKKKYESMKSYNYIA